ncbi:I10R1 protein, partial [Rhinopomastus cyanomelas]|nr:I10R1 protein [Rhinopomastus cyanomelas]
LALCVALLLIQGTEGERLVKPTHVHFAAQIGHHLLCWEPGSDPRSDVRYEVEHKVYGTNTSWTAIPNCRGISGLSCDLTYYTLDPTRRYYARVRAVLGNRTSLWQRTNSFSPQEASLWLSGQSISVMGNTIHVKLQLLLRTGNLSVRYDDVQRHARRYRVHVRRARDNQTFEVMETSTEFSIPDLFWGTEYCVSVEPDVASRRTRAVRTREHCVTVGEGSSDLDLSIGSSFFITLLLLGLLGVLLVCTYIKKPVRPPAVLKSFIKQSSLWMEESLSSSSPDTERVQQLFLCQKDPKQDSDPNSSSSTAQLPLEKGWRLPAWPEDQGVLLGLGAMARGDRSGTSTDSGICLHISSSNELSCSSSPEPQGYKQQLPTGDDSGVGLWRSCPHSMSSSSPTETRQPHGGQLPATSQDCERPVEFRGYLQQSKVEPRKDPAQEESSSRSPQGPGSAENTLDIECSELAVAKGYLKQFSTTQPTFAPWGDPTAWDFSSLLQPQAPTLLSCGAPGGPVASKADTELLRAPLDLSTFNTDLLRMLPL